MWTQPHHHVHSHTLLSVDEGMCVLCARVLQVEMWTQPQHHVHSAVKKNRRNPKWKDQVLEVLVQEPDSQVLRVVMHDIDILNPKVWLQYGCQRHCAGPVAALVWYGACAPVGGVGRCHRNRRSALCH